MEKNEIMGLLIFAAVAVVGAVLLMTSGLNVSEQNTGLATKQYISQKTLASVKASQYTNCVGFCEKDKNACESKGYNKYISCSGNYKATTCPANWDKAKIACANVYYGCVDRCGIYQ